jgi:rod shape-determining protein MreC
MNKKIVFFLLVAIVIATNTFKLDQTIFKGLNNINNNFKSYFINKFIDIQSQIDTHFFQKETINKLKEKNALLEKQNISLKKQSSKTIVSDISEFIKVNVLSYVTFNDYTKVWVDYTPINDNLLGLIYDNNAVGVLQKKDNKSIAYLNGDQKCNYTVFIGENKIPAIIHPIKNSNNLNAKYIPLWSDIKVGDNVITSGLDKIFFEGLEVGKVLKIVHKPDSLEAIIKTNINVLNKKTFFIYKPNI